MTRRSKLLPVLFSILAFITLLTFLAPVSKAAEVDEDEQRIFDDAAILTTTEYEELEAMCNQKGRESGIEIFILTHDNKDATYPEAYIENFEDQLPVGDRVYFLYDLNRGEIFIEVYGLAETYIHSKRIEVIFDNLSDDLRSENYYDAFTTYIGMVSSYMFDDSELNYDQNYSDSENPEIKDLLTNIWFQLIASLILGGIVVGVMAYNSGGRMTVRGNNYLDDSHSGLIGRRDMYVRTSITRIRKPTQPKSSGRGGFNAGGFRGGISGGGRSHSSGGRKL
ncbi:MAG TPA: TPM domain-containing protein [Mobilitalea sp.]|nr:TPM domain-containing protein [Mobilitalea sp.]